MSSTPESAPSTGIPRRDAVKELADHLRRLRAAAGGPSLRQLADELRFGKSTIGEAFGGKRLPRLDLVEALVARFGGDVADARDRWHAANARRPLGPSGIDWLMDLSDPTEHLAWLSGMPLDNQFRNILASDPGPSAFASDRRGPHAAIRIAWSMLHRAILNAGNVLYNDWTSSWSSSSLDVVKRMVAEDILPRSAAEAAEALHRDGVRANFDAGPAYVEFTAWQAAAYVVLANRLAALISQIPELRTALEASRADVERRP